MIIFLFIPALLYFLVFMFYATWNIYWARDPGTSEHIDANQIMRWISLGFLIEQIIITIVNRYFSLLPFHWRELADFWNVLDFVSLALNLTVIICDAENVAFDKTTAVASIAVGLMWIKLFYYC